MEKYIQDGKCPYCGTLLTTSLKFCVNCRCSITETKIKIAKELVKEKEELVSKKRFKLVKKSYGLIRQIRSFCFTLSTILMLFLVYYICMKFFLNKPVPGEQALQSLIEHLHQMIQR